VVGKWVETWSASIHEGIMEFGPLVVPVLEHLQQLSKNDGRNVTVSHYTPSPSKSIWVYKIKDYSGLPYMGF
jgi:hypothetical protein